MLELSFLWNGRFQTCLTFSVWNLQSEIFHSTKSEIVRLKKTESSDIFCLKHSVFPSSLWRKSSWAILCNCMGRGHHTRKFFTKVTQIVQFIKRNNLGLVPSNLKNWFWSDFTPKFGLFKFHISMWKSWLIQKITPLLY